MITAQEAYAFFIKTQISPRFRSRGWRGSSGRYTFASGSYWILAGFQKSAWSDRSGVRFTVNLTVASRTAWESRGLDAKGPKYNTSPGLAGDHARLGMLASSENRDDWWSLTPDSDLATLADEVMMTFDRFGGPWLADRSDVNFENSGDRPATAPETASNDTPPEQSPEVPRRSGSGYGLWPRLRARIRANARSKQPNDPTNHKRV